MKHKENLVCFVTEFLLYFKDVYGGDSAYFRMLPEMSKVNSTVIVYMKNGQFLELKNFLDMSNKKINLPFKIDECFWMTPSRLMVTTFEEQSGKRMYTLKYTFVL